MIFKCRDDEIRSFRSSASCWSNCQFGDDRAVIEYEKGEVTFIQMSKAVEEAGFKAYEIKTNLEKKETE